MIKMLKSVAKLINDYYFGERKKAKYGNHSMQVNNDGTVAFYYHNTAVCRYNPKTHKAVYDNGGWNTSSTTRTINSYKEEFEMYK